MPAEQSPSPERRPGDLSDPVAVQVALAYFEETKGGWTPDPTQVVVEQPPNQTDMLNNLHETLSSRVDAERWVPILNYNLHAMAETSQSEGAEYRRLFMRPETNPVSLDDVNPDTSWVEHRIMQMNKSGDTEYFEPDKEGPNDVINGLLRATGARILRDDIADGNEYGVRVYKGMFADEPVYFTETLGAEVIRYDRKDNPIRSRYFSVQSEKAATEICGMLSAKDRAFATAAGIDYSAIDLEDTTSRRASVLEILQLNTAFSPVDPNQSST